MADGLATKRAGAAAGEQWVSPVLVGVTHGRNVERKALGDKTDDAGIHFHCEVFTNYAWNPYPVAKLWQSDRQGITVGDVLLFEMPIPAGERAPVRLDDVSMMVAGHDVHIHMEGHGDTDEITHERNQYTLYYVALDWYNHGGAPGEKEGAATFIPVAISGGGEVDPAVIRKAVSDVLGLPEGVTLVQAISGSQGGQIRQGLEDKTKDALSELFNDPPRSDVERVFQERFFQYVKNANAGVQANILNGQDEWGARQRTAFIALIREALAPHALIEGTEGQRPDGAPGKIDY